MSQGPLRVEGEFVVGEIALAIAPGTVAAAQERAIDAALAEALATACAELGVTLAAAPSRFAQPLDGKDAQGRVRFRVRGRLEGDRLVPAREKKAQKRAHADERAKARAEKKAREEAGTDSGTGTGRGEDE